MKNQHKFSQHKIPKEDFRYIYLSKVLLNSDFRTGKNFYPQVFLEECKYVVKEKMIPKYIIDDIEISSDSDRENSDEENSHRKNSDREISDEKHFGEEH